MTSTTVINAQTISTGRSNPTKRTLVSTTSLVSLIVRAETLISSQTSKLTVRYQMANDIGTFDLDAIDKLGDPETEHIEISPFSGQEKYARVGPILAEGTHLYLWLEGSELPNNGLRVTVIANEQ